MVRASLRVEVLEWRENNNPFYGNSLRSNIVEETYYFEKDVRKDIAPYGVKGQLEIGDTIMKIKVNRHYLEAMSDGLEMYYYAFFKINDRIYELNVWFNEENKIASIALHEWLDGEKYEDGSDADNVYNGVCDGKFEEYNEESDNDITINF